ncbi:MAG: NIPSNAP family protein [Acidobacteriota bacterium]
MDRRQVLKGGLASAMVASTAETGHAAAVQGGNHYYELRTYELRNDLKPARLQEYFQQHYMPFLKRAGAGPIGCFNVISGKLNPALIVLIDYPSLGVMQSVIEKSLVDKEFSAAARAFETAELAYVRYESVLLRAFDNHPKVEVPEGDEKRPARVFELRTYESRNAASLRDKIAMFNQEEIKIFRASGFAPVFFGEGVIAPRMPHLTYMVGFDNMAARDKCWDAFRIDPDWARVRVKPGWTDAEVVSNSETSFLRPTSFSQIR